MKLKSLDGERIELTFACLEGWSKKERITRFTEVQCYAAMCRSSVFLQMLDKRKSLDL